MEYRVISIGALSKHPLWSNDPGDRTAHATTVLISSGRMRLLVDPGLPAPVLGQRLAERANLSLDQITHVFLTNFRPAHRRGLEALGHATWWISEAEREAIGTGLVDQYQRVEGADPELEQMLKNEIATLQRCQPAPDQPAKHVDLFPLPGFTPGCCGLLLSLPRATVLLASDAVATMEHLEQGKVLQGAFDVAQARESLAEAIEIADWLICGHDNLVVNLTRRMF